MVILIRIVVGLFLLALAVCLGGMTVDAWETALWPQGDIMKQLQWPSAVIALLAPSAVIALLATALTVLVGVIGFFVLFTVICKS